MIAEDIQFINRRLRKSQYFYIDIRREGILLHDSGKFELAEPKELSSQERKQLAQEDFEYWLTGPKEYFLDFKAPFERGNYNNAAFLLHQVTERLYSTILLVFTRYKPGYKIARLELEWLVERVQHLQVLTEKLCKEKIESYK